MPLWKLGRPSAPQNILTRILHTQTNILSICAWFTKSPPWFTKSLPSSTPTCLFSLLSLLPIFVSLHWHTHQKSTYWQCPKLRSLVGQVDRWRDLVVLSSEDTPPAAHKGHNVRRPSLERARQLALGAGDRGVRMSGTFFGGLLKQGIVLFGGPVEGPLIFANPQIS